MSTEAHGRDMWTICLKEESVAASHVTTSQRGGDLVQNVLPRSNDTTYLARIGGVNISEGSNDSFVQRNVVSVHVHPDYNERQHYADVALLLLDRSGRQSDLKRPFACLPDADDAEPDTGQAVVLGWGHDVFGGRLQTHLQEARVPLVANDLCNDAYRSLASYEREFPRGISGDFICAGNITDGGVDACQRLDFR
ncbi:hypothetical protein HPB47_011036 [Ixodes persulcatus]|uniref:Uncharacterized protein n=1 Tax=Ixodes persulcatus TaxID=34615 RepID=A0AC60NXM8_IXOPE|nr:hypothetical protein HPB47_011036 [Ixodes persulcatus]